LIGRSSSRLLTAGLVERVHAVLARHGTRVGSSRSGGGESAATGARHRADVIGDIRRDYWDTSCGQDHFLGRWAA
jgi:hypothetical protein